MRIATQIAPIATQLARFAAVGTFLMAGLLAQTEAPQRELPPEEARKLSKEQIQEQLDKVKEDLLPRIWAPKIGESKSRRRKYLEKWQAVTSEHYIVFTDGPTTSSRKYAITLEENYDNIKKALPFDEPDSLMTAYIFKNPEDYYRFSVEVTKYSEEGARATAGHANGRYYATYYQSPRAAVVYHEATHQIVMRCMRISGVGSWFQEGMAVYFEKLAGGVKPEGSARADLKRGDYYALDDFFGIQTLLSDPQGNGRRNYAHAGALIDFMINTKVEPVAGKFEDFLAAARKGRGWARGKKASVDLVREVYGLSVEQFEAHWREHLKIPPSR